jgi:hypothetical protein
VVGSIPDLTARRIPEASFVLGPRPVFPGVTAPSATGSSKPFGPLCFGFNRDLASEPARLERIMTVVDELAGESRMYLTAAFGIEGKQWTWERTSDGRWPKRLASSSPANTGRYWIFPWSPFEEQYDLAPRVLDSITSSFGTPRSLYATASGAQPRFRIPYGDSGARATEEKARYETLYARIWTRFSDQVVYPVMYGTAGMSVFDDFLAWYHDNGGDELARIVTRWAER